MLAVCAALTGSASAGTLELRGRVEKLAGQGITVAGPTVQVTARTTALDQERRAVDSSELEVGAEVEVIAEDADGQLEALSITAALLR